MPCKRKIRGNKNSRDRTIAPMLWTSVKEITPANIIKKPGMKKSFTL